MYDRIILSLLKQNETPKQMTTSEFKTIATEKFNTISTNDLIVEAKKLMLDASNASDIVFEVITDILFERMPEAEFVEFSKSI